MLPCSASISLFLCLCVCVRERERERERYGAFHGFGQAKFAYGSLVIGSSQFTLLPPLPVKTKLNLKVVKIDSKIIISLPKSKSVIHSVGRGWERGRECEC